MESEKMCSKCGKNPAQNGQAWCRRCRSDHELTRQATQVEMEAAKWWTRGAEAMRLQLARPLACAPGAKIDAWETARWMMDQPVPSRPTE